VITTEKLSPTVGALVEDVDADRLLHDPDIPTLVHEALEANGALVFRGLHLDDDAQIAFSHRLGEVE
jgi:alpha-ketoglutarate-dependent taurine dioxygenase